MSSARYSRLPTSDDTTVTFDFGSAFSYGSTGSQTAGNNQKRMTDNYKSAFTYDGWNPNSMDKTDARYEMVKPSLLSNVCHYVLLTVSVLLLLATFPITAWFCFKKISSYERMLVFRLGKISGIKGPGMVMVLPCTDRWERVDLRLKAFNVPPQQLITADRGVIEVGADIHYKVINVKDYVLCIQDANNSLRILVKASLTNHIIRRAIPDLEQEKFTIMDSIKDDSNRTSKVWGIEITRVTLSSIKVLKSSEPPQSNGMGIPAGLPQTFQQLTSVFLQAATANKQQTEAAEGCLVEPTFENVSVLPVGDGAAGSEDVSPQAAPSPLEVLSLAKSMLTESMVKKIQAIYLFRLSGNEGGMFFLDLKNGSGNVGEGLPSSGEATTTLTLSVTDMQLMFLGDLKPMQAYMSGRLQVSGDLSAALRLEDVIKTVAKKFKSKDNHA